MIRVDSLSATGQKANNSNNRNNIIQALGSLDSQVAAIKKAKFIRKTEQNRGYLLQDSLKGHFSFIVPNSYLGIENVSNISSVEPKVIFYRLGKQFAECQLAFDGFNSEKNGLNNLLEAKFAIDIRNKPKNGKRNLKHQKGICDTSLMESGIHVGIPNIKFRDIFKVIINGEVLSTGKFRTGKNK